MPGTRQKRPGDLANARAGRGRKLDVLEREEGWKTPPLPADVTRPRTVFLPMVLRRALIDGYMAKGLTAGMTPEEAELLREQEAIASFLALEKQAKAIARGAWRAWWNSYTSYACQPEDMEPLRRWIIAVFQLVLFDAIDGAMPLTQGANCTWVRNPLGRKVRELEARISRAEDRYGMNTVQRFRLQLNVLSGKAKLQKIRANEKAQPPAERAEDFDDGSDAEEF